MKKLLFFFYILINLPLNFYGMQQEKIDKIKEPIKTVYKTQGERAFFQIIAAYRSIKREKEDKLKKASKNIWKTCFSFALEKKDELGNIGRYGVGAVVNFDYVKKEEKFFEKKVYRILKRGFSDKVLQFSGDFSDKNILFQDLDIVKKDLAKDILYLGAYIASENEDDFKEMLRESLRWGFGWLNIVMYPLLAKSIDYIEQEIDAKVVGPIVLKKKED